MQETSCGVCGGDGRIGNAFGGNSTRCPACQGSGRKGLDTGMRDVTKTKASHHRAQTAAPAPAKPTWPSSTEGSRLAREVQASPGVTEAAVATLVRRILEHEATHGSCTDTFLKKMRKEFRPAKG
jgi:hypothetical protein